MYAKVNWENQTIEFISDEEANKVMKQPVIMYYINDQWLDTFEVFDSVQEAIDFLMSDHIYYVAEAAIEDDWFIEEHPELGEEDKDGFFCVDEDDLVENHADWIKNFLEHYKKDIIKPYRLDDTCELIKVPD